MTQTQYEELKNAIKELFELLTNEEQEQIVEYAKELRKNNG